MCYTVAETDAHVVARHLVLLVASNDLENE